MVGSEAIQTDIVALLKATSAITDVVGSDEVREAQWQGLSHDYPNVRVRILRRTPNGQGACRDRVHRVTFVTVAASEDDSSRNCLILGDALLSALSGQTLPTINTGPLRNTAYPGPVRDAAQGVWATTLTWEVTAYG